MDPEKVSAIFEWPLPKNASELRSFLGACLYKQFLGAYSTFALKELTKLNCTYNLADNKPAREPFDWLKHAITTAPVPAVPEFNAPLL